MKRVVTTWVSACLTAVAVLALRTRALSADGSITGSGIVIGNRGEILTNAHVVRHWYVPALHADFGFAWPLVALLPLAGVVLACRKGRSTDDRVLAFAACVAFVVFLVTPSGAQGPPGQPFLFGSNVRYAMPASPRPN